MSRDAARASWEDRAAGALLGTFAGDAVAAPYEGAPAAAVPARLEMPSGGRYTDDTQMALALAASLLRCDRVDAEDLAGEFRAAFEPGRGYGAGTIGLMSLWDDGVPVAEAAGTLFGGSGSHGNGAAMRIAPLAVRFAADPDRLAGEARASAQVTHRHVLGIDGACAQAAAVAAALRGEDPLAAARAAATTEELRAALADPPLDHPTDTTALGCVPAAVAIAARAPDPEAAITAAARLGGDTDTAAAMAGAIAAARDGVRALPPRWLDALEGGPRGRDHAEDLARRLARRAAQAGAAPSG